MKKFLLLVILVFSLINIASVLDFTPNDSSAVFYIKNLDETYTSLKTVPTFKNFLLEPINAEIALSSLVQMYLRTIRVEPETFFDSLKMDMVLFIQEPSDSIFMFGAVFGPLDKPEQFYQALSRVITPIKEMGINFSPIYKQKNGKDYLILVQDKSIYENSRYGRHTFDKVFETGIYYIIKTDEYENSGHAYVKDNYLVGEATGSINIENVNLNYVKNPQDYDFLGTIFVASGFLPKDISAFNELIDIVANPELVQNILDKSDGFEFNARYDLRITQQGGLGFEAVNYFKIQSDIEVKSLIPIFEENNIVHEYKDDKIIFKVEGDFEDLTDQLIEIEESDFYLWKENSNIMLSNMNQSDLSKSVANTSKLSNNNLFKLLSARIGSSGDINTIFIDISKFYEQFVGLRGEFGFLLITEYLGDEKTKTSFILK